MKSVAVVGSGIAGLAAAHALVADTRVTLFEAGEHFGGHTNTVDVTLDGITHGVDTGFLVFNERGYPQLTALFAALGIPCAPAEMSFSVQSDGLEWSGSTLNALFAQRRNLLRPRFWSMLADLQRFNRVARSLAAENTLLAQTLGDFLDAQRFGQAFRELYLLPMLGCIWSCPTEQMLRFPLATLLRFCDNHGLLQITRRPQWCTVAGGARQYVRKMLADVADARLLTPVQWVRRLPTGGVMVHSAGRDERFDELVLACHSDEALSLLVDASADERALLGAIGYQRNRAVLHTDASLMPLRRRAWAAWNYERAADALWERGRVSVHYWLNRLQPLPWQRPLFVSLNPSREPAAHTVLAEFDYAHPVFDQAAIDAQRALPVIQGRANTWFCGAWIGYGFHEDGLRSGLSVAEALRARQPARPALRGGSPMSEPLLGIGVVRHRRLRPVAHAFEYPAYFVLLPLRRLREAPSPALPRNRFGLLAFHDRDHGDGRGDCLAWLDELLAVEGIDASGEVWLHCYPRVLGYAFKPVSFWYCERADGSLAAIVVEVNNTFGERHCYLLDGPELGYGRELVASKVFHVSPFCAVEGRYRFRFLRGEHRTVVRIENDDDDGPLLVASVSGKLAPLTPQRARAAVARMPWMGAAVIARIHWQALKLWLKRVPLVGKPAATDRFVTR